MEVPELLRHCSRDSETNKYFNLEVSLSLTLCRSNAPNYQENDQFLENCFRLFYCWKFHWIWRDVGGTPGIIKKIKGFWKILLGFWQCWKWVDRIFWVSLTMLTWLRNYGVFYFGNFTEFDVMSEECPKLSRKWRISWNMFKGLDNTKSV